MLPVDQLLGNYLIKEKRFAVYVISNARQTLCVGVTDTLLEGFRPLHNDGEQESRNDSHLSLGMLHLFPQHLPQKSLHSLLCKRSAVRGKDNFRRELNYFLDTSS
jgi:hypothetical protein